MSGLSMKIEGRFQTLWSHGLFEVLKFLL